MSETEKKNHRSDIKKAKKIPPAEPFRIMRTRERVAIEVKVAPPTEPTRKTKPKEIKKGKG